MEYVKKHVKIVHEGHKPEARSRNHKCPQCGKAFIQPSDLRRHVVGMISHKMSLITIFGQKYKIKNFIKNLIFLMKKFQWHLDFGSYLESNF